MPFEVQSNCRIVLYNRVWDLTWSMKLSTPYSPKGTAETDKYRSEVKLAVIKHFSKPGISDH